MRRRGLTALANPLTCVPILIGMLISVFPARGQDFDAITNPKPGPGEYKVWRIDRPEVRSQTPKEYPTIRFNPGDVLTFVAGGCVQTGGHGKTWKRYVNPLDSNAGQLYSGTVFIPGVIPEGSRIGGLVATPQTPQKQFPVPQNLPPTVASQLDLRLGYEDDQYSDNGYYSHDDGTSDQCKNVGNAYMEVHIRRPPPVQAAGPSWSPHSKPFDLVWDENTGIDANGLPLNPIWASQIAQPGVRPSFINVCQSSFSGGTAINYTTMAANCSSQSPSLDLSKSIIPLLCASDPLRGHVNWSIATFIGTIAWSEWSGNSLFEDDDFNLALTTTNSAALTDNSAGLGLEFNGSESIETFTNPWWTAFGTEGEGGRDDLVHTLIDGKLAVVTGLFGLDCVHDCYSESHPVYALAIRSSQSTSGNTAEETWNFFLRNSGNEGNCSELWHDWSSVDGSYYIQLPWPAGAASVNLAAADASAAPFGGGAASTVKLEQENGWTYLAIQLPPPSVQAGVDGQVTLHYTLGAGSTSPRGLVLGAKAVTRAHPEDGVGVDALRAHITDAAALKRFDDLNHSGASAWRSNFPKHTTKLTVSTAIAAHQHVAGPANRGQLTRDVMRADPARTTAVANAGQKAISTTPLDVNALRKLEPQPAVR